MRSQRIVTIDSRRYINILYVCMYVSVSVKHIRMREHCRVFNTVHPPKDNEQLPVPVMRGTLGLFFVQN